MEAVLDSPAVDSFGKPGGESVDEMASEAAKVREDQVRYMGQTILISRMERIREANRRVAEADRRLAQSRMTGAEYRAAKKEKRKAAANRERLVAPLKKKQEEARSQARAAVREAKARRQAAATTASRTPAPARSEGRATIAYRGSNAVLTRRTLRELEGNGQLGRIAAALFRAQKSWSRAKRYRGGPNRGSASYSDLAYRRKGRTLATLRQTLIEESASIAWGWGIDDQAPWVPHVLYADIPTGQVSFHSIDRFEGPDYPGSWDGIKSVSAERILLWCDRLLGLEAVG
jgi:hypothetical protein